MTRSDFENLVLENAPNWFLFLFRFRFSCCFVVSKFLQIFLLKKAQNAFLFSTNVPFSTTLNMTLMPSFNIETDSATSMSLNVDAFSGSLLSSTLTPPAFGGFNVAADFFCATLTSTTTMSTLISLCTIDDTALPFSLWKTNCQNVSKTDKASSACQYDSCWGVQQLMGDEGSYLPKW